MSGKEIHPWKRFWRPEGVEVSCGLGGEGFFDDPEAGRSYSVNAVCRPLAELVADLPVLVLCGPPGSGKSTELESICRRTPPIEGSEVIYRRASAFAGGSLLADTTVRSPEWQRASEKGREILLLIDGIDEALQREHSLLTSLVELLRGEDLGRIRLVLSCRSAIWQPETGAGLARLWGREGTDYVYEICPLRRIEVAQAAGKECPGRTDEFLSAVERAEAIPLARWPITLNMLVDRFKRATSLPDSRKDLYHSAVGRMLDEWDEPREQRLRRNAPEWRPGEKLQLARRIAALSLFGGKFAVSRSDQGADGGILSYDEIMSDGGAEFEASGTTLPVTREKLDDLTATRLFEKAGSLEGHDGCLVKFSHRTFEELLAGEYVAKLSGDQLRRLFFVRQASGEELIVPQLLQAAAWLAGASVGNSFFDLVLALNPEAFLLADLAPLDDDHKAAIVKALLDKAASGDSGPDRAVSKASRSLEFPGIDGLLAPAILDQSGSLHLRRFAMTLARTCRIPELADTVWEVLDRPNDPMALEAAHCLRVVEGAAAENKERLLQLAASDSRSDSSDTVKGVALELLVPGCVPVRDVLDFLTPPQMEFYFGSYRWFLTKILPNAVAAEDLVPCLKFLISKPACFDSLSTYEDFANRVFDLCLENLHEQEVSDSLVRLWLEKSRNFQPLPRGATRTHAGDRPFRLVENPGFVEVFLNHPETTADDLSSLFTIGEAPPLATLLEKFPDAKPERRPSWARAIRYAAWYGDRLPHRALLQQRYDEYPEIRAVFPRIQKPGCDLHGTLCRHERAGELRLARRKQANQARMERILGKQTTWKDVFCCGLEQCIEGHAGGWIHIARGAQGDSDSEDWAAGGVETSELFSQISDDEKETIRGCAKRFLLEFDDDAHTPRSRTKWSETAYAAVKWLRDEIAQDGELRDAVSEKWIGAIIDAFNNGEPSHQELVRLAYSLNPEKARKWLRGLLDRTLNDEGEGWLIDLRAFEAAWDRDLSQELGDFLGNPSVKPRSMREGLRHLLAHDREFGSALIEKFLEGVRANDPRLERGVSRAVAGVALFFADERLADAVWPLVAANHDYAKILFQEAVHDLDRWNYGSIGQLRSARVTDLLLLMFRLFPPAEDPPPDNEVTFVSPLDSCIQFRGSFLQILTKRGEAEEIQRFLKALSPSEAELYRWSLDEARQMRAQLDWAPARPDELLRLVRVSNGSLIRNGDDLIEVVLGSLSRFQDDLQGHHLHRLWDGDRPKLEEFVSKEIESWLKSELKDVVVDREVEVNRLNQRVDLKIEALPRYGGDTDPITLIIEVKRAQNPEIPESIEKQLVEKYLLPNSGWNHGIFLVAWFGAKGKGGGRNSLHARTPKGAESELRRLCDSAGQSRGLRIEPFILDCSRGRRAGKGKAAKGGAGGR